MKISSFEFNANHHHTVSADINNETQMVRVIVTDSRLFDTFQKVLNLSEYHKLLEYLKADDSRYAIFQLRDMFSNEQNQIAA